MLDPSIKPKTVRRYLLPGEKCLVAVRRHWSVLIRPLSAAVGAAALVIAMALYFPAEHVVVHLLLWPVLVAATLWGAWHVLVWRHDYLFVTDRRVMVTTGVLTRRVLMLSLAKVTELKFQRSLGGRILGHGTLILESDVTEDALKEVEYVPWPDTIYVRMCDLLFEAEE
ncbi:PH domain-containing protein [Yinghuangia sp. ASG 101]|uniref:PH domain-containing protein n=1 Tax=Yinghuangia sp. ASG 101 TaxID=2896848 RepID=UPI001E5E648C|nr:PH domain-containing protein [Yinghuangia sp. ASG 101]UGQ08991.1 PH domain-containing protein [Yinghuangia sp. ASG 101]